MCSGVFSPLANGKFASASCRSGRISSTNCSSHCTPPLTEPRWVFCNFAEFHVAKLCKLRPGLLKNQNPDQKTEEIHKLITAVQQRNAGVPRRSWKAPHPLITNPLTRLRLMTHCPSSQNATFVTTWHGRAIYTSPPNINTYNAIHTTRRPSATRSASWAWSNNHLEKVRVTGQVQEQAVNELSWKNIFGMFIGISVKPTTN